MSTSNITKLEPHQIFVFGSNQAGRHGAGAAKYAKENFGAESGKGVGMQGQCYAIPTKDFRIKTLPLDKIAAYVSIFISAADMHPDKEFLVTEIGCGLAGYTPAEIAPLFERALEKKNVRLPESFRKAIMEKKGLTQEFIEQRLTGLREQLSDI